ncbi:MAG TPA: cold-shock protein [Catenuloplanes sp.]|jgi:2-phospho-L-lactate guanylyltransferase
MQGTVATFDEDSRSGTLLLDDGAELRFGAPVFEGSHFRLLRSGQRVTISVDDSGQVTKISLPGLS